MAIEYSDTVIYPGQRWLINHIQALNYPIDSDGICFGVTHMALQAILAKDLQTLNTRLKSIYKTPAALLSAKIKQSRRKQNRLKRNNTQIPDPLLEVPPFFEGIAFYQSPNKHSELLATNSRKYTQVEEPATPFVLSQKLEAQGGIIKIDSFSGAYTEKDLEIYFESLSQVFSKLTHPVAFVLKDINHVIALGYDPVENIWQFIDANALPAFEIKGPKTKTAVKAIVGFMTERYYMLLAILMIPLILQTISMRFLQRKFMGLKISFVFYRNSV